MRFRLAILITLATLHVRAGEQGREVAIARHHYADAEFGKAAAQFEDAHNTGDDAEAFYGAATTYQILADIASPFGCKAKAKAHSDLRKAVSLAPGRAE